jgi:hypothetical protein
VPAARSAACHIILLVRPPEHPARRPTRYHWAAGLSPLHLAPALGAWLAVLMLGVTGPFMPAVLLAIPWLAAAALLWSAFWLFLVPNDARFRRVVDAKLQAQYENDYSFQLADLLGRIDKDLHDKVQDLTLLRDKAREILSAKFGERDPFAKDNLEKLDRLAISYLQLLAVLSEYAQYMSLVDPPKIEADLAAAEQQAAGAAPALADVRGKQVLLLRSRLERYRQAEERSALAQAQCVNVETTMKLLVDQAMTVADPQRVGQDIDQVLENIRDSEVLQSELQTFDDLERELDGHRLRAKE